MAKLHYVSVILLAVLSVVKTVENSPVTSAGPTNTNQEISSRSSEETGSKLNCPSGNKDLCLILALSRIAKVQVADPSSEIESRNSRARTIGTHRAMDYFNTHEKPYFGQEQKYPPVHGQSESVGFQQRNVHCRAIRDIYIPEVGQKLPAFACKYGNRTFVLSSGRFLEDRRPSLDISLDETSFKNMQFTGKLSRGSDFSVIPALLVLRAGESNYKIRPREDIVK